MSPSAEQSPWSERVRRLPDEWLEAVEEQERRGELLAAFDLAERGLGEHPGDLRLEHRAVLALARAGATGEAARRFDEYRLGRSEDEDVAALGARIAKDVALGADGAERQALAGRAAELYGAIAARTRGYYPAVNAATLWLIAGQVERSRELARGVLATLPGRADGSYYAAATSAEAHLLLGEVTEAGEALQRAAELDGDDLAALATTRRQLRLVCQLLEVDPALLAPLRGPSVVHFCGHRITGEPGGAFPPSAEPEVAGQIAEVIDAERPGFSYGALASGADILWAEALLAAGSELHVVLPFAVSEFVRVSVEPAGPSWVKRFHRCLGTAVAVDFATEDAFLGEDVLFSYGSEFAMGLALLRARYLDAEVRQLAVWDREPAGRVAGTAVDVARWCRTGRSVTVVTPGPGGGVSELPDGGAMVEAAVPESFEAPRHGVATRVVRAMLFADLQGFSMLTDEQLPVFTERVLGSFASVLERRRQDVWHRNTWGDGMYVVLSDVAVAAACALELQEAIEQIDLEAARLPADMSLRLGGHVGPVFPTHDPVRDALDFVGSHVSRTARIEPVTPPGAVYVTEPFAAAIALEQAGKFACDYVGRMPAAKDYGVLRMYRLRRTAPSDHAV
jgi:class 3 adenylate cyclase/tetratricopeptide (TPR) repeat protein